MRSRSRLQVAALVAVLGLTGGTQAQFVTGNLTVLRVGDGSSVLTSASTAVFLDQYNPTTQNQAAPNYTVALPTSGSTQLTNAGNATPEGQITRSTDGSRIVVAGYDTTTGTANVPNTSGSTVNRVVNAVDAAGAVTRVGSTTNFSTFNVYGTASVNGTSAYMVGRNTTAIVLVQGATSTTVSSTSGVNNQRATAIFNGNLYFSSVAGSTSDGSTVPGIYRFSGLPTGSGNTPTQLFNTSVGSSTDITKQASSFAFAVNPAETVVYVADDRATANSGGVQKWTLSVGTWSLAGVFSNLSGTNGARGLAVNFSGTNPVLYATTVDNKLVTVTDTGSNFTTSATVLATAGANTAFRGVTFSPVPEPSAVGLFGAAACGVGAFARRKFRKA